MKTVIIATALLTSSLAVFASTVAQCTPSSLTRSQVQAELMDAIRSGDIIGAGEISLKLNELYPHRYPAKPAVAGKTRQQVAAELADAIRSGDIITAGESALRLYQLYPLRYPRPAVAGKTREQVKAELANAIRSGDIILPGEIGLTRRELYAQMGCARYAGESLRAA